MERISSRMTLVYKYVFPLFWFGFLAIFVVTWIVQGTLAKEPIFLIFPCLMVVVGAFAFRRLVWDLADVVLDGGDYLLVRNRGSEERISLSNIMNVSSSSLVNPPRITLRLINQGSMGPEIAFSPLRPFTFNLFARNAVADDLITRVHNARSQGGPR